MLRVYDFFFVIFCFLFSVFVFLSIGWVGSQSGARVQSAHGDAAYHVTPGVGAAGGAEARAAVQLQP